MLARSRLASLFLKGILSSGPLAAVTLMHVDTNNNEHD